MEITLNDLVKETGFEKRQILNWYRRGLLPEPIRVENTGREAGKILYFSEEALHRLRSIQKYPVTKLTKTMGLDSLAFLLFIFGFKDDRLCEMVRSFLLTTVDHFQKSWRKEEKENGREALFEGKAGDCPETPTELVQAAFTRMMGGSKKEAKKSLPDDTGSEIFDPLISFAQEKIQPIFDLAKMPFGMPEFIEIYLKSLLNIIPDIPSFKDMKNLIPRFSTEDFDKFQINLLFSIGFLSDYIVGHEKMNEILKEEIQLNNFMGLVLTVLYIHFIFTKDIKLQKRFFDEASVMVDQIKNQSSESHINPQKRKSRKAKTANTN